MVFHKIWSGCSCGKDQNHLENFKKLYISPSPTLIPFQIESPGGNVAILI
jgi:hypothetical protein